MKILIANDDGIFAPGIAALVRAFSAAGHEVIVCAPDGQRSAASHSISIAKPVDVKEIEFQGAVKAYAIGGTPADCVKLGLTVLCPQAEAVVSGINKGYNVGTDILYSGTVAAAMEGAICGRPALAISQMEKREDYTKAAELAEEMFEKLGIEDETEASTVSGWVMEKTEKIPQSGDTFDCGNWHAVVLKADDRHVQEIQLTQIEA